jgi:Holliday junction resolvase RusA-like endonuclease
MRVDFTIPGKPVAKQRPRKGAQGRFYTPARTMRFEQDVATAYLAAGGPRRAIYCGPVDMHIALTRPRPTSWPKWKSTVSNVTARPDADNLAKSVIDGLNGVAYHDDAQVTYLSVSKEWGTQWSVKVTIETEEAS